ncbi:gamma-glutamylcyclotransferase [Marinovum sp.]|uniref:gamma-glutamylcyclotransferase n=1 Tax=Marinovum sp. TaxID=2024839 RepID=UPI002B277A5F|nr:gamma-glutamylcyclotransferase [Marinovum sp.]
MADLFVYGTLCHLPLLERVLGRPAVKIARRAADLPGWAVYWAQGESFPTIRAEAGGRAKGLILRDLGEADMARLDHYEGGFGYALQPLAVETADGAAEALVYLPEGDRWPPGAPWHLGDWVARYGPLTLAAADEVMERFGLTAPQEIAALFPWIRARGWAQCLAQEAAPTTLRCAPEPDDYRIEAMRPGHEGFFRLRAFDISHRRFDGSRSATLGREAFQAYDAALVLPYDPVSDQLMLVEQFRFGPVWRRDPVAWMLEPIAGLVDAGERPADCARREAVEEAGLELGDLRLMTRVYASPGYSSEFFHCYLGLCDLSETRGRLAGLAHENEDIRSHVISFERAMALVDSGEANAGPLAMMLLWLARHREELRRAALPARP